MSKSKTEGIIQREICGYLEKRGHLFFRTNNTPTYDPKLNNGYGGYRSQSRWSQPGLPDICVIDDTGHFIGLEVKTPKGRQSADQKLFEKKCEARAAEYYVVRSVEDVKNVGL